MRYTLRDANGIMKAKLTQQAAMVIFASANGHWRKYTTRNKISRCFEFDEDSKWGTYGLNIYLWAGDKIVDEI